MGQGVAVTVVLVGEPPGMAAARIAREEKMERRANCIFVERGCLVVKSLTEEI